MGSLYPKNSAAPPFDIGTAKPAQFIKSPIKGHLDSLFNIEVLPDGTYRATPALIESYRPEHITPNDQPGVYLYASMNSDHPVYLGSESATDDTPLYIYRGNGQQGPAHKWGGLAIGVYQDGDYGILEYFNSNGDSHGIYINENGLHHKETDGTMTPLADYIAKQIAGNP